MCISVAILQLVKAALEISTLHYRGHFSPRCFVRSFRNSAVISLRAPKCLGVHKVQTLYFVQSNCVERFTVYYGESLLNMPKAMENTPGGRQSVIDAGSDWTRY